jgi:hypothetical protein
MTTISKRILIYVGLALVFYGIAIGLGVAPAAMLFVAGVFFSRDSSGWKPGELGGGARTGVLTCILSAITVLYAGRRKPSSA